MMKKAVAYVSDIILGRTGEVISREAQKELIRQYAAENSVQIVQWFEDEAYNEDVLTRPGIQRLLSQATGCDCVVVERIWTLSRQWPMVRGFMEALEERGLELTAATIMWDCTSQRCRHAARQRAAAVATAEVHQPHPAEVATKDRPSPHERGEAQPARGIGATQPKRLNFIFPEESPELV